MGVGDRDLRAVVLSAPARGEELQESPSSWLLMITHPYLEAVREDVTKTEKEPDCPASSLFPCLTQFLSQSFKKAHPSTSVVPYFLG